MRATLPDAHKNGKNIKKDGSIVKVKIGLKRIYRNWRIALCEG